MLKATTKETRNEYKTKIRAKNTSTAEAVVLMARICKAYCEKILGLTSEKLLDTVRHVIDLHAEEGKGGLTVRCHKSEVECEHFDREDGWCNRFDRPCAEVHDDGEAEDE